MTIFSTDQVARARAMLADPDQGQSPNLRAMRERIARHVLTSAEAEHRGKIVRVPRTIFQAGLRAGRLTCIDGGRK